MVSQIYSKKKSGKKPIYVETYIHKVLLIDY